MIESLTPEQEARFPEFEERWVTIGLATDAPDAPFDLEAAKTAAGKIYAQLKLPFPDKVYVADSPLSAAQLVVSLGGRDTTEKALDDMLFNQHNAGWLAFYEYFYKVLDMGFISEMDGFFELAQCCGWWAPYKEAVVFQRRPSELHFDDDDNRLHNPNGPAVRYRDGFGVYCWHGTDIPSEWIEDKENSLTPEIALTWENVEQRRAAAEILGWDKVISHLNPKIIDKDPNPEIGELLEVDLPDSGPTRFVKVLCGTGRTFVLCVPNEMRTALEAVAWTYNLKPEEYNPEVRT